MGIVQTDSDQGMKVVQQIRNIPEKKKKKKRRDIDTEGQPKGPDNLILQIGIAKHGEEESLNPTVVVKQD